MCAFDEGTHISSNGLRILSEGPCIDDGVVGIVIDVGVGGKDPLNTERSGFVCGGTAKRFNRRKVAGGAEGHHVREARCAGNAGGGATLEIRGNQERGSGLALHVIDERRHLKGLRTNDISVADAAGDDKAAYAVFFDPAQKTTILGIVGGRVITVPAHDYHLRDAVVERQGTQSDGGWISGPLRFGAWRGCRHQGATREDSDG